MKAVRIEYTYTDKEGKEYRVLSGMVKMADAQRAVKKYHAHENPVIVDNDETY